MSITRLVLAEPRKTFATLRVTLLEVPLLFVLIEYGLGML